ncbi:cytochrome c oxidase subunit II [Geomonas sp. Red32]|uniref:cytochrome c oxidase subunit II n=1 Tax=Geomonas sp. Red32 TaxID=2912856 RepID=UPI00202D035B|nr:cytochrome c oxidase subunit II [Geomonas sp. Red32]MCM0083130.1 cytochrome c oxidase subunit II [Geomonas sp. Red32]
MPDLTALQGTEASLASHDVDAVFIFILVIAAFFFVLTQGLLIYFAVRYRRKKGEPPAKTPYITGKQWLEVVWIVLPSLLLVGIFAYGVIIFVKMRTPIPGATDVQVTASQFQWSFKYPDGRTYSNELHLAVGKPVKLIMTSRDVIHGLFIPDYRQKQDVLPGRYTYLWLLPKRIGTFDIYCSQYCGTGHSLMRATLTVMGQNDYLAWEQSEKQKQQSAGASPKAKGKALFDSSGCGGCHSIDGSAKVGPTLKGVFGSTVTLADGKQVKADEEYLRESITEPNEQVVKGFQPIMPTFKSTLKDDDIAAIIAYIKTLK